MKMHQTACVDAVCIGKFQTDVVKDWAKELYSLRSGAYSQQADDAETKVTS